MAPTAINCPARNLSGRFPASLLPAVWRLQNPAGIVGDPEDIGHLIAFLASDNARYINAANLRIDGGTADSIQ